MYDFFSSKFGMFLLVLFFAGSVVFMGLSEIHQRYAHVRVPENVRSDRMVRELHGDVSLKERSARRRQTHAVAKERRSEDWQSVKSFAKDLVP